MITREGTFIIIPCPNCEHDMLEQNGLDLDDKSLNAKCHKCGQSFNVINLVVFKSVDLTYSEKIQAHKNTPNRFFMHPTMFDNLN